MICPTCHTQIPDEARFCPSCGHPLGGRPPVPGTRRAVMPASGTLPTGAPQPGPMTPRKGRPGGATLGLALLFIALSFVSQVVVFFAGEAVGLDGDLSATLGMALGGVLGICALGGWQLVEPSGQAVRFAVQKGWWVIATSLLLMVLDLVLEVTDASFVVVPDWPARVLGVFMLCAAIGIAEESLFRGLLLGGLLDALGAKKGGVVAAAVISAILFGAAHVQWWDLTYSDPLQVAQALLKTLQTGTYGFFLAALVIRSGSLVGAALLHGLDDFLLMVMSVGFMGESSDISYVSTGADAWPTIILYSILIVLYLPIVWQGVLMLRETEVPERGRLHRG